MNNEINNSIEYWNKIHENYSIDDIKYDDWLDKFSNIISNCNTPILDLGCGSGNNTLYLTKLGKEVVACDLSQNSIDNIRKNFPDIYDTKCFNMLDGLPFDDNTFELVVADLSLHYFKKEDTEMIVNDLKRVITNNGHLIIRVNSINDVNHGAGQGNEIEHNLYENSGVVKWIKKVLL